jgi:hypothetical protein
MEHSHQDMPPLIDVTGLPEAAIREVGSLVTQLRGQTESIAPASLPPDEWKTQFDAWMQGVAAAGPGQGRERSRC